jgi:hypothetical protein
MRVITHAPRSLPHAGVETPEEISRTSSQELVARPAFRIGSSEGGTNLGSFEGGPNVGPFESGPNVGPFESRPNVGPFESRLQAGCPKGR